MASKRTEIAIEKIVAACDGNMRGALEALLLVNEHLSKRNCISFMRRFHLSAGTEKCCETMH